MDKVVGSKLYIGSSSDARHEDLLVANGITAVVNVARDLNDPWFGGMVQYKIGLDDGSSTRLEDYVRASLLVISLLRAEDTVLLHCHEGRSRTAAISTIVLAVDHFCSNDEEDPESSLEYAKAAVIASRPLCAKMEKAHEPALLPAFMSVLDAIYFGPAGG